MKTIKFCSRSSIFKIPVCFSVPAIGFFAQISEAQNVDDGSTASWNMIHGTTVMDSDYQSHYSYEQSEVSQTGSFGGAYGSYTASSWGRVSANADLKAYTRVSAAGSGLGTMPSRINGAASAFFGEYWDIVPSEIYSGGTISSVVDLGWDGTMTVATPGGNVGSPYFNEVGVSVDFNLYEVFDEESEPVPVLNYVSGDLVLRTDGTDVTGEDFENTNFGVEVIEFDPANPYMPTGDVYSLDLQITPQVRPMGEIAYEIELSGELPFEATVGSRYLVTYGLSVYANVTGVEGFAEADFGHTGTVDLEAVDPSLASFVMVPEPDTMSLWFGLVAVGFVFGRRRAFRGCSLAERG